MMADTLRYTLPFPPSINTLFRNLPKGGRVKTSKYKEWIGRTAEIFHTQAHKRIQGLVDITILLYRPDQRKRDLDNYLKALLDFLVTAKVIDDDSCVQSISIKWGQGSCHEDCHKKMKAGGSCVQIKSYETSN